MIGEIFAEHPWLWPLAWQSTLCLAAGLGGSVLLRRHAVRAHQVLLLGLVAAVLVPALSHIVKRNQWGLLVAERAVATPEHRPLPAPADFVIPDQPMATEPPSPLSPTRAPEAVPAPARTRFEWTRVVLPAWLAISLALLLRLAVQFLLGRRLAKRSEAVKDPHLLQMIEFAREKLGIRAEVRVRASAQARSPVIWCWGRRLVLLIPPESRSDQCLDWPSILCHELAHAKRHDHISGLLAELMVCALPWQPLLWRARQRLAALSEEACDDWVIACGQRATGYARTLLGLTAQGQAAFLPGVVTSRRGLAGRVRRVIEDGCGNPRPGLRWTLAVVALAGGISLSLAFAQTRPAPRPATETPSSAASRERLNKILDAMLYHDRAVLPIALHTEIDLYSLDAPADAQHDQTYIFEQRLDGKRLDSLMNVYRLRDGQFRHDQVNRRVFTGEQFVYRQQQIGNRSYPLHASLDSKEEATRILGVDYMWGCTLLGHLPGDEKPVATLLKNAAAVVLREEREDVDGFACHVIEGKTDHGVYKLWIDPAHDFRIRRATSDKGPDDLFHGRLVSQAVAEGMRDRNPTAIHAEISGVKLEKIGGHFIATVERTTTTTRIVAGTENHSRIVVKRSPIDPNPDFEKLGAFVMDGIPEGAPVFNSDPNDPTYAYEWHEGKAVSVAPDGGTVVGRLQLAGHPDLRTILTDRRRFEARFTRVSTPASVRGRRFQIVTLAPGENGTFRVKDVPPGEYRLQLALTDLIVEKLSSGGYVPRDKLLAEAERDVTIPEAEDAAQKTVDLGVIEMTLAGPAESAGGTNTGKGAETAAPADRKPPVDQDKISLRLVDPNGRPVAGAQVGPHVEVHELPMLNRRLEWPLASTSDENGQVAIETKALFSPPVKQGQTSTSTVYALHEKRGIGAVQEIARADSGNVRTLVLRPVCRVHGTVRSTALEAKGMPLRWASLNVDRNGGIPLLQCSFERDDLHFEFSLPPGNYGLESGGTASKVPHQMSIVALTEFTRRTITVTEGQRDLDLGAIDLPPTKVSALIGRPAPEIGPVKAWRSGLGVTLAGLKGRLVWLHLGGPDPDVAGDMARLVELCEAQDFRGLTIVAIFGCDSLEELRQRWAAAYQKAGGAQTVPFYVGVDGGATRATYGITRGQDVLIDPAGNVVGVPSTLFAKEAVSSILGEGSKGPPHAWRKQFDEVYFIESHEVLKRIAPPYIAERLDYYREKYPGSAERIPRGPDRMVLTWNGALKDWGMGYGPANWLSTILTTVLELRSYEYDGPQELLNLWLPGDWIVRREAPREAKLRALEELVAHELARKIRFEQRSVPREALVVTGRFQFHPIAPLVGTRGEAFVHFYTAAADLDESTGGGGTALSVRQFLEVLGDHIQMPIVGQTEPSVLDEILYHYHTSSSHLSRIQDPQEKAAALKTLLDNVSTQTELQFEIRKEPVPVWFVTE